MKKKIIALDMDGTLLNSNREIDEETASYLRKLNKFGYPIIITSGRPKRAIMPYYEQLGLKDPVIAYNGTYIFDPYNPSFEEKKLIPSTVIIDFIKEIGEDKFENIMIENDTDIYMLRHNEALFGFFWKEGMNVHFGPFENLEDPMYIMIIQMYNHDYDEKLVKLAFTYPGIGLRFWSGEGLTSELYFLEQNKASALKRTVARMGYSLDDVIAFGDAENDVEMLEECGISVAMKNGQDLIKEKAKMVSLEDNDHAGIKLTLQKILGE